MNRHPAAWPLALHLAAYDQAFRAWQNLVAFPALVVFERAARPALARLLAQAGKDDDPAGPEPG